MYLNKNPIALGASITNLGLIIYDCFLGGDEIENKAYNKVYNIVSKEKMNYQKFYKILHRWLFIDYCFYCYIGNLYNFIYVS